MIFILRYFFVQFLGQQNGLSLPPKVTIEAKSSKWLELKNAKLFTQSAKSILLKTVDSNNIIDLFEV